MTIMQHFLDTHVSWGAVREVVVWSDGGRHFRSRQGISTVLMMCLDRMCKAWDPAGHRLLPSAKCCFGVPAHFKNLADGKQAHLRQCLKEAASAVLISDLSQFIAETRKIWQQHSAISGKPVPNFVDWFPTKSKHDFMTQDMFEFHANSFREAIGVCQCFAACISDVRRVPRPTFQDSGGKLTAVKFKSSMLPRNERVTAERQCQPVAVKIVVEVDEEAALGPEDAAAAAAEDAVALVAFADQGSEAIGLSSRQTLGWMTSYRSNEPEKRSFASWRSRWSKARARFSDLPLEAARLRRSQEAQLEIQEEWRQRRKRKK